MNFLQSSLIFSISLLQAVTGELVVYTSKVTYGIPGETVRIPCTVTGQDTSFTFTFFQDTQVIYARVRNGTVKTGDEFVSQPRFHMENNDWSVLVIEKSEKADYDRKYECTVRQKNGANSGSTELLMADTDGVLQLDPATSEKDGEVRELNGNVTAHYHGLLIMEATAHGYTPQPSIEWVKNNITIYAGPGVAVMTNFSKSTDSVASNSRIEYMLGTHDNGVLFGCRAKVLGKQVAYQQLPFAMKVDPRGTPPGMYRLLIGIGVAIVATILVIVGLVGIIHCIKKREQKREEEAKSTAPLTNVKADDNNKQEPAEADSLVNN